jgi:hypothetical protein
LEICAHLQDEDSIAVTTLRLSSARLATVVDKHATVEALASSDSLHSRKSRSARRSRDAAAGRHVGVESSRSSGQGSTAGAGSAGRLGASAVAALGRDALRLTPLGPRVAVAAAILPALGASVGAEGESEDCELSVLHFGGRFEGQRVGELSV